MAYLDGFWTISDFLLLALTLVKLFAFVDAALRPAQGYTAADKLTKQAWLLILGLMLLADLLLGGFGLLGFIGIVAALVYLVDVRPKVAAVTRR